MNTKTTTTTTLVAILAIATVAILVTSTAIVKPALASRTVTTTTMETLSKSDIRDTGNFLKCIANHGGNDISKNKSHRCVENNLG